MVAPPGKRGSGSAPRPLEVARPPVGPGGQRVALHQGRPSGVPASGRPAHASGDSRPRAVRRPEPHQPDGVGRGRARRSRPGSGRLARPAGSVAAGSRDPVDHRGEDPRLPAGDEERRSERVAVPAGGRSRRPPRAKPARSGPVMPGVEPDVRAGTWPGSPVGCGHRDGRSRTGESAADGPGPGASPPGPALESAQLWLQPIHRQRPRSQADRPAPARARRGSHGPLQRRIIGSRPSRGALFPPESIFLAIDDRAENAGASKRPELARASAIERGLHGQIIPNLRA